MKRAFSLVEILVVIAIILVLAGIAFPILGGAKDRAKVASCTGQLRQLGVAIFQYRDDNGGEFVRFGLDPLVELGYVKEKKLLKCPSDPTAGFMTLHYGCMKYMFDNSSSYYTPFANQPILWEMLQKIDNNPGILACRCHGSRRESLSGDFCKVAPFFFDEHVLRLRTDGSVKMSSFTLRKGDGTAGQEYNVFRLFTDNAPKLGG